jgi:hypothetical protein
VDPRFPQPKPREEFVKQLRARLIQEAPVALAPRRRGTAWAFLRPALGAAMTLTLLFAGAGTAAAGSVAGDATFGLKRAFEDLQVNLTLDDVQRVELLAKIADRRLQELQQVANRGTDDVGVTPASEEFRQAVLKFRAAVNAVQPTAPAKKAEQVQQVVDKSRDTHAPIVDALHQKLNDDKARDALDRARDEEDKDTSEDDHNGTSQGGDEPKRSARPTRVPTPARSARPTETTPRATPTPRGQETGRPASPRPTGSGRVAQTPKPGEVMDPPHD